MWRIFRRASMIRLGRWDTNTSDKVISTRAHLANHDSCGAHDCETPIHLADVDEDADWYARYLVSPSARPAESHEIYTRRDRCE